MTFCPDTLTSAPFDRSHLAGNRLPHSKGSRRHFGESAAELLFKQIGENPDREGLLQTPMRFAKAWDEICSGYEKSLAEVVGEGIFSAEGQGLVSVCDIEFFSLCEHHMLPFWGKASMAYYPNSKILGLSKLARIVEMYSRRLQVQERLTTQIADALLTTIAPRAVAVKIRASHMCMMMRGIKTQNSQTITETLRNQDDLELFERERLLRAVDEIG